MILRLAASAGGIDLGFLSRCISPSWTLYLSAKWVNYLGLMSGVVCE